MTNIKVKIDFTLPEISAMNVVMWKCHVDDSAKGRYDMILGQDILTWLGLNLKWSEHFIEVDDWSFKGSTITMVDLVKYLFKDLNIEKITSEEFFTNTYVKEVYDSEHVRTDKKITCSIICQILKGKFIQVYGNSV